MSAPNTGWNEFRKALIWIFVLSFVLVLTINTVLVAGPVGDPEPAPPGIPWSEEDPPSDPDREGEEETPSFVMSQLGYIR
ncbi:hypothetical protein KAU04_04345 [bacterium]|nr:hypothetical protein [bacterium]